MSYDDEDGDDLAARQEAGSFLTSEFRYGRHTIEEVLESYAQFASSRIDPDDVRSTAVDALTDVAHDAADNGISLQDILNGSSGIDEGYVAFFGAMKSYLETHEHSYEEAISAVGFHLDAELPEGMSGRP